MVPYHRPKSGHITCYLNRTYHVLLTLSTVTLAHDVGADVPCRDLRDLGLPTLSIELIVD